MAEINFAIKTTSQTRAEKESLKKFKKCFFKCKTKPDMYEGENNFGGPHILLLTMICFLFSKLILRIIEKNKTRF